MIIRKWLKKQQLMIKDEAIVRQAFTHSSYVNETMNKLEDNERLEYVGDAVLQLWTARFLYLQKPQLSEGQMTLLRAQLVSENALAGFANELEINECLLLGVGEIKQGGRQKKSILADTFEAIMGALFLDGNLTNVQNLFDKTIAKKFDELDPEDGMDYKTKLQEFVQADTRKTVNYELISSTGPSNHPTFESRVVMDGLILGKGKGHSKKKSQQAAAKDALEKLVK